MFNVWSDIRFIRAFIAKGIGAIGSVALLFVIGKNFGPAGVGVFAIGQSFLVGGALIACLGMDNALLRFVGREYSSDSSKIYLEYSIKRSLMVGAILVGLIIGLRSILQELFKASGLAELLAGISISIPLLALAMLMSGYLKGVRKPDIACIVEGGFVSLLSAFFIMILAWFLSLKVYGVGFEIGLCYTVSSLLVVLIGAGAIKKTRKEMFFKQACDDKIMESMILDFRNSANEFFVMGLASFVQASASVLIAGFFLDSLSLGYLRASQQIASIIGMVLIVVNSVYPPKYAQLFYDGRILDVQSLAKQSCTVGLLVATPLFLVCLFFPEFVVCLLDDSFRDAAPLLIILAVAQFVNVATGSVGFLLNMAGREKTMRKIVLFSNLLGIVLLLILTPIFGVLGATVAIACLVVVQNLVALCAVKNSLGIWPIPLLFIR